MPETTYPSSLPAGTRIDEYQLLAVLGQGSFGITYLAEDINLGARLAIKEYLPDEWAVRDAALTVRAKSARVGANFEHGQHEFLEEARLLARVAHPNIVKVRRFFRAHGTAYIAMDFVAGSSLGEVLDRDYRAGGYPSAALKRLLVALLEGLSALHAAGIIHRDIKPGNIILEPDGNPILVDFGAARHLSRAGMTVIVTHGYAPIEQYAEDGAQGPFTDIYALGALAHRAITGQPPDQPYKRLGRDDSLAASLGGAGRYPAALLAAIDWALAVQPQDRPQSAADLLARLAAVPDEAPLIADDRTVVLDLRTRRMAGSRAGSTRLGAPSPTTRIIRGESKKRRRLPRRMMLRTGIAALVLLALAGGAATYVTAPQLLPQLFAWAPPLFAGVVERVAAVPGTVRSWLGGDTSGAAVKGAAEDPDEAARRAAAAAEAEHERVEQTLPPPLRPESPVSKAKAHPEAAARQEAARAAAAAKAEHEAAAAARQQAKPPAAVTPHSGDRRCTSILQNAQLAGGLTDADRAYLREHCH